MICNQPMLKIGYPVKQVVLFIGLLLFSSGLILHFTGTERLGQLLNNLSPKGVIDENYGYILGDIDKTLLYFGIGVVFFWILSVIFGIRVLNNGLRFLLYGNSAHLLLALSSISLVASVILIVLVPYSPWADFEWYTVKAGDIVRGLGITEGGRPTAYWPIGYSLFLAPFYAMFGSEIQVGQVLNVLLRTGMSVLTYFLGGRIFDEVTGRIAFAIMSIFPSLFFYSLVTGSDILFATLYVLIAYLLVSTRQLSLRRSVILGVLLGIGTYVRPMLFLIPVMVFLWFWLRSRKPIAAFSHTAIVAIVAVVILLPWTYRNYQAFDRIFLVSTNSGINMLMGNNPYATGGYNEPPEMRSFIEGLDEASRDEFFRKAALDYIIGHPDKFILNSLKKVLHLYIRDDQGVSFATKMTYQQLPPTLLGAFVIGSDMYYYLVLGAALAYMLFNFRTSLSRPECLLLVGAIIYVTLAYIPFIAMDRYHLPVLPMLSILAAAFFQTKFKREITDAGSDRSRFAG